MDVPEDCDISDFEGEEGDSVNIADLGLLKFGRCHHCCIGVALAADPARTAAFWLSWAIPQAE